MSARSRGSLPSSERGVAVIMAMLTVALVATLAASIVSSFGFAVESLSGRHDLAQARWLARGSLDWARNVLSDDKQTTQVDHLGEPWAIKVPATPVDEGEVSGEIDEQSGRFNLNQLINQKGTTDKATLDAFAKLLSFADVPPAKAKTLAATLAAWMDPMPDQNKHEDASGDLSKATHAPMVVADELLDVPGFDSALLTKLKPFIVALPSSGLGPPAGGQPVLLNINTCSAEVLAAMVPDLTLAQARVILAGRASAWFKDISDFNTRTGISLSGDRFGVTSRYFLVVGRAKYGSASTRVQVMLDRKDNWPLIIWQRIL